MRTILCLIQPFDTTAGARVDVRVGDSPSPEGFGLGGYEWEAAIVTRPTLTVELLSPDMQPRVLAAKASFVVQLRNITAVPNIVQKDFQGAPVLIWSCDDLSWARRKIEFTGFVTTATLDPDTLTVSLECDTSTRMLQVPLLWDHFTGAGGLNGDAAMRGTLKPAGFGAQPGVEPVWFDATNNIGMLDGYGNLVAVTRLLEGASAWGAPVNDYATYGDLLLAITSGIVGPGQWATCIAQGLIGLGAPPHGVIMCDCTFGYGTPGTMIPRVLETHAGIAAGEIDMDAMASLNVALQTKFAGATPAIHFWTKDQRQVDDLIQAIAGSCNASPLVSPQGLITVTRAVSSDPVATLNRDGSSDPRVLNWKSAGSVSPFYLLRARVARPARVLTRDEVNFYDTFIPMGVFNVDTVYRSGNTVFKTDGSEWLYINETAAAGHTPPAATFPPAALASDAWWQQIQSGSTYADGTPIDNLKPQEVGANKTETRTSLAILGQGVLATANAAKLGTTVVRQDNVTVVTDATAITSLGTAAAIAAQGVLATANATTLGAGGTVLQSDGLTHVTDATAITSLGTAAAIASQGALATLNAVDLATAQVVNKSLANVDPTASTKLSAIQQGATRDNLIAGADLLNQSLFTLDATGHWSFVAGSAVGDPVTYLHCDTDGTLMYGNAGLDNGLGAGYTPVTPGEKLFFSALLRSVTGGDTRNGVHGWCDFYKADGTFLSSATIFLEILGATSGAPALNTWLFCSQGYSSQAQPIVVPANAVKAKCGLRSWIWSGTVDVAFPRITRTQAAATVGGDINAKNIIDSSTSYTPLSRAALLTSMGTAAAIAGQGVLATLSAVALDTQVTDGTTYKRYAATEQTKLTGIETNATLNLAGDSIVRNDSFETFINGAFPGWTTSSATIVQGNSSTLRRGLKTVVFPATQNLNIQSERFPVAASEQLFVTAGWNTTSNDVLGSVSWFFTIVTVNDINQTGVSTLFNGRKSVADGPQSLSMPFTVPATGFGGRPIVSALLWLFFEQGVSAANAVGAGGEVDWFSVYRAQPGATVGADINSVNLIDSSVGSTALARAAVLTALGTASAIASQGSLATKNLVRIGGELYRSDGATLTSDAGLVTSLGTAAAISSQGALATLNSVDMASPQIVNKSLANLDSTANTKLTGIATGADVTSANTAAAIAGQGALATRGFAYFGSAFLTEDSGGATQATLANFKTASGTAAGIVSQGSLATLNAVDLATTQVVNKSLANLDSTASTKLTGIQALADVTSGHTAAAIAGQGTGATANSLAQLNSADGTKLGGISTGADVTINSQLVVAPIPDIVINFTSAGAVSPNQLPMTLAAPRVTKGGTAITGVDNLLTYALSDVSASLGTVTVDNTSGAATKGQVTLANTPTALTGAGSFTLTVSYNGVVIAILRTSVTINQANPPSGGSSGGNTGSIGDTVSTTSFVQVGSTIAGVSISGGKSLHCSFGANYDVGGFSHSAHATVKFRYAPAGTTTYSDVGSPATGTAATRGTSQSFSESPGSVSYNQSVTPATGTYDVSMWAETDGWPITFDGMSVGTATVS